VLNPRTPTAKPTTGGWYACATLGIGRVYWAAWPNDPPNLDPWEPSASFGYAATMSSARAIATHELSAAQRTGPLVDAGAAYAYADSVRRRGGDAAAAHQAWDTRRNGAGTGSRPTGARGRRAPPQTGSTNRTGSYWIACMVAELCNAPMPDPARWGFTSPPPRPPWAEPHVASTPEPAHAPAVVAAALTVLGVGANATVDEVSRAYRKLALKHHPDRGGTDAAFIRVTQAYSEAMAALKP
jgi:hypothetical protein